MQAPRLRVIPLVFGTVIVIAVAAYFGTRWMAHRAFEARVLSVLKNPDMIARMREEAHLRDTDQRDAVAVVVGLLDDPDVRIRRAAGQAASMLRAQEVAEGALIKNLETNSDPAIRMSCAICLMQVNSPTVTKAYLRAIRDSYDHVAEIACSELGERGGPGVKEALDATLSRPSWRVRLAACKALIRSKSVDTKTIATLEEMRAEPEAAKYDAEIAEFDRMEAEAKEKGFLGKRWGEYELDPGPSTTGYHKQTLTASFFKASCAIMVPT